MATARDFIELCLREVGVTGVGQTALPEDINDAFTILNRMIAAWQQSRWLVPNLIDIKALGNGARSNMIGPGAYYNTTRPDKIQAAYFKQLGAQDSQNNVSYPLIPIRSYEDYANKIQLKDLATWPSYYFYDNAFPYGNVFIWPIPDNNYEVHLILKGPIGFTVELKSGVITNAGLGYTDGVYLDIPFVNVTGFGTDGTADVTVAGGVVTVVAIHAAGDGYKIADILTLDTTLIGGTGAGFLWTVNNVQASLDAEFNMPAQYEEAIHYNLCVRLTAHYQYDPNPVHGKLAFIALNRLKVSNTQVSQLQMPSGLRFGGNGGFYIFNADQN